ncbi:MAG TPA: 50S ribosomal protein L21 [Clostridia bacterium]|nr:50S ribosomal protein L21 [Clostridia bacterium]
MYAVIRAGGKQYRVAPGDVIRIEKTSPANGDPTIEFSDILAVSGSEGHVGKASDARVVGQVLGDGRADKILVFHFKRKKQYKKLRGHRQAFTEIRISEISFDGQTFSAPELPAKKVKAPKAEASKAEVAAKPAAEAKPKKTAAKKTAAKKTTKK